MLRALSVSRVLCCGKRVGSTPVVIHRRGLSGADAINALRPFYFAVHPDFFGQHPREREVNENSLKRLNGYLENIQKPDVRSVKPARLTFYVRETMDLQHDAPASGGQEAASPRFRWVSFTLRSKDLLSVVEDVLRSCSLSLEHLQSLSDQAQPAQRDPATFYRPIKWDKSYYTFTGFRDPEQELEQASRVEPTLSLWLRDNEAAATKKEKESRPRREELRRLIYTLCKNLGLLDIRWQRSWGVAHRCCQLQSLIRLSHQSPESLINLQGHTLVFTDQSGMNASGHVMLGSMDVHQQWTKLFERLPSYRALLHQTEWLKERIGFLLGGIQVIHHERLGPVVPLEEHYSTLNNFHKGLQPRPPTLHPRSLQGLAMTLESDRTNPSLHEMGHYIIPSTCDISQLQTFLQSHAQEARSRISNTERLETEEKTLVARCAQQLSLRSLRKDPSVSSTQMMACCRRLMEERSPLVQGMHVCVSHFYSVMEDGDLCIPWDWKS